MLSSNYYTLNRHARRARFLFLRRAAVERVPQRRDDHKQLSAGTVRSRGAELRAERCAHGRADPHERPYAHTDAHAETAQAQTMTGR